MKLFGKKTVQALLIIGIFIFLVIPYLSYVPVEEPKTPSHFQETEDTQSAISRAADRMLDGTAESSAFLYLIDGTDALGARLRMIEAAEDTLDLQYFLMKPDKAGAVIAKALWDAADRGVRVRFLLDDIFTEVDDTRLAALNTHENIEIRYFNPISRRAPMPVAFAAGYPDTNRRMHNKSITADGKLAVLGGRNIADEYYNIGIASTFADFDILAAGDIVTKTGAQFDVYWNDYLAVPLSRFATISEDEIAELRENVNAEAVAAAVGEYENAVNSSYLREVMNGEHTPYAADAELVFDLPEKLRNKTGEGPFLVADALLAAMSEAEREVTLITPYFVPQEWGRDFFLDLEARGINVRIVTNSLAANNHAYVHGGYLNYRPALLAGGVEFYEVKHNVTDDTGAPAAPLTMHSKVATIDDRVLFFGSLNFDPRSVIMNTELGVFVESPEMAGQVNRALERGFDRFTYRVVEDENGDTAFLDTQGEEPVAVYGEPQASTMDKIVAWITQYLPVERQL